jgi:hypothetical protein
MNKPILVIPVEALELFAPRDFLSAIHYREITL